MSFSRNKTFFLFCILALAAALPCLVGDESIRIVSAGIMLLIVTALCRFLIARLDVKDRQAAGDAIPPAESDPVKNADGQLLQNLNSNLQVFPLLTRQLEAVIQETESAVLDIGDRFMDIVSRARGQAEKAGNAFSGFVADGKEQDVSLVEHSKKALSTVIGNLRSVSDVARHTLESMRNTSETIHSIRKVVSEIEYIANQTNMLAINASVEAARAGQHGRGFAVVAEEVRKLSSRSTAAAGQINQHIQAIESEMRKMSEETEQNSGRTEALSRESETIINETMDKLNTSMSQAKNELDGLSQDTEALARDISGIVFSMQFQDIARQRIEHVIEPLGTIKGNHERMAAFLRGEISTEDAISQDEDISWVEKLYTMESERQVMKEILPSDEHEPEFWD